MNSCQHADASRQKGHVFESICSILGPFCLFGSFHFLPVVAWVLSRNYGSLPTVQRDACKVNGCGCECHHEWLSVQGTNPTLKWISGKKWMDGWIDNVVLTPHAQKTKMPAQFQYLNIQDISQLLKNCVGLLWTSVMLQTSSENIFYPFVLQGCYSVQPVYVLCCFYLLPTSS